MRALAVVDRKDCNTDYAVSRRHLITKLAVHDQRKSSGHLTGRNEFGCLLQLESLLVHEVTLIRHNAVGIKRTHGFVGSRIPRLITLARELSAGESALHF